MGIPEKIKLIEEEMRRTQINKATERHLGVLKAQCRALSMSARWVKSEPRPSEALRTRLRESVMYWTPTRLLGSTMVQPVSLSASTTSGLVPSVIRVRMLS